MLQRFPWVTTNNVRRLERSITHGLMVYCIAQVRGVGRVAVKKDRSTPMFIILPPERLKTCEGVLIVHKKKQSKTKQNKH